MDLDRDAILNADDLRREPVAVPEWGGTVYVQTMMAPQLGKWQAAIASKVEGGGNIEDDIEAIATLLILTLVDANGQPLFTDADVEQLAQKNPAVLKRLGDKALRVNALDDESAKEMEKNSDAIPAADSP